MTAPDATVCIVAEGDLTADDLAEAHVSVVFPRWLRIAAIVAAAVAAAFPLAALLGWRAMRVVLAQPWGFATYALVVLGILYLLFVGPARERAQARRFLAEHPERGDHVRFTVSSEGVGVDVGERVDLVAWQEVHALVESRVAFLFALGPTARYGLVGGPFVTIPKRLLARPEDADAVRDLARWAGVPVTRRLGMHAARERAT